MRSVPEIFQAILDDERKRNILFKVLWMGSLGMLVLGYLILVVLIV